jgi:putative spermidine/putrescine transport system permease protein
MAARPMNLPRWLVVVGVLVFGFMLLPVALVVWMSVFDSEFLTFPPSGYSLRWFGELTRERGLFGGLRLSFVLALCTAALSTALGLLAAIGLSRARLPRRGLLENGFLLPLLIPAIVSGVAVYIYLYQLSWTLQVRLVPTLGALLLAHTMITLPWTFRLVHAGLSSLGTDVERASLDLGRGPWQTLWRVTLPLLRPSLVGAFIFAFIFSFAELEISLFLISPGQITLPVAMVQYAEFRVDPTLAAVSTVQIVLVGTLLAVSNRFIRFGQVLSGGVKG